MHITVSSIFIHIWIILFFTQVTKCANYTTQGRDNITTEAAVIDRKGNGHSKTIEYNLEKWLEKQTTNIKKVQSITIIPILALIVFLWIICFRACKWIRQDSKYKERGCSYDVTSYVIVKEEDKDFDNVDFSSSTFLYDTVTSKFSLQEMLDYKMYDTVTSHASILKRTMSEQNRRSPTPDGVKQEQQKMVTQKKGRFSVAPVIDNYVRLKNIYSKKNPPVNRAREVNLSASLSGNSLRLKRKQPPRRSTSDSRLAEHAKEKGKKNDIGLQVRLERIKERLSHSASIDCNTSESEHSIQNSHKFDSSVRSNGDKIGKNKLKEQNHSRVEMGNKIDTMVEIHSEDKSSLTQCSYTNQRGNVAGPCICLNGHIQEDEVFDQYSEFNEPLQDNCVLDFTSEVHDTSCVSLTRFENGHSKVEIPNNHRNSLSTSTLKFFPNSLQTDAICGNNNIPKYEESDSVSSLESSVSGHSQIKGNDNVHSTNELNVNGAMTTLRSNHDQCSSVDDYSPKDVCLYLNSGSASD